MTATVQKGLPGEVLMWVLIFSELAVFGGGLVVFMALRLMDATAFAESQTALLPALAGTNTVLLITSGFFAALAAQCPMPKARKRQWLAAAALLGVVFLILKGVEFQHKADMGITFETNDFFMLYYLLTGFHAVHVLAGVAILCLVAITAHPAHIQTGTAFWHMVDLVWVLLFPVIYLL